MFQKRVLIEESEGRLWDFLEDKGDPEIYGLEIIL